MQHSEGQTGHDFARYDLVGRSDPHGRGESPQLVDAVVVGAGFAGLYLLHRLRQLGFSTRTFEAASDVGGTWFWNRYPGARCDIATTDYTLTFDAGLDAAWTWSEKFATQPEILRYAQFVADRLDLRRSIEFNTRVLGATWDEEKAQWTVRTDRFGDVRCRFLLMATGMLSVPKEPDLANLHRFAGPKLLTGRWPEEPVNFSGQRVIVVGTGSSAVQLIPEVAQHAASLTVLQRTPVFAIPARNGPQPPPVSTG